MSIFRKIARVYLYILSFFYFIIGITALLVVAANFFPSDTLEFLIFPGIIATTFGLTFGLIPVRLILGITAGGSSTHLSNPSFVILTILGSCAVILSCLGIYALYRISHQHRWIGVWYLIVGIAAIMMIDNLFYTVTTQGRRPLVSIGIGSVVHFIFLFWGIWTIRKEQKSINVIPSPHY